jgi:hypothetical protein
MAAIDPTDKSAERVLRIIRNIGLGLLVASAFTESAEGLVRNLRMRKANWERESLSRVDSRSTQIAELGMAFLDYAIPDPNKGRK